MPKLKIERSLLAVGLIAAALTALYKALDNYTVHSLIVSPDKITVAYAYFIIGAWTVVVVTLVCAPIFGRWLDPHFKGIVLGNRAMRLNALCVGLFAAIGTFLLLWGQQYGDPAAITALTAPIMLFTGLMETFWKKTLKLRNAGLPIAVTCVGGFFAAWNESLSIGLITFGLVFLASNLFFAVGEVVEKDGVQSLDAINFMLWRFSSLALIGTVLCLLTAWPFGYVQPVVALMKESLASPWTLLVVTLNMVAVFFAMGFRLALKRDHAVSVILVVLSAQVVFSYAWTFIGDGLKPGAFGAIPDSPEVWAIRIAAVVLLICGMVMMPKPKPALSVP